MDAVLVEESDDEEWPFSIWMEGDSLAPFRTSAMAAALATIEFACVREDDTLMDLGAGDGRVLIAATKLRGARGIGLEIEERVVEKARRNVLRNGVEEKVEIFEQDMLEADLSPASVIFMYLLPDATEAMKAKLTIALQRGVRLVCHFFQMKGWTPTKIDQVNSLYLYDSQSIPEMETK